MRTQDDPAGCLIQEWQPQLRAEASGGTGGDDHASQHESEL